MTDSSKAKATVPVMQPLVKVEPPPAQVALNATHVADIVQNVRAVNTAHVANIMRHVKDNYEIVTGQVDNVRGDFVDFRDTVKKDLETVRDAQKETNSKVRLLHMSLDANIRANNGTVVNVDKCHVKIAETFGKHGTLINVLRAAAISDSASLHTLMTFRDVANQNFHEIQLNQRHTLDTVDELKNKVKAQEAENLRLEERLTVSQALNVNLMTRLEKLEERLESDPWKAALGHRRRRDSADDGEDLRDNKHYQPQRSRVLPPVPLFTDSSSSSTSMT